MLSVHGKCSVYLCVSYVLVQRFVAIDSEMETCIHT